MGTVENTPQPVTSVIPFRAGHYDVRIGVRGKPIPITGDLDVLPTKDILKTPLLDDAETHRTLAIAKGSICALTPIEFLDVRPSKASPCSPSASRRASGGIGPWEKAKAVFFDAEAERIGASSGDVIVSEWLSR